MSPESENIEVREAMQDYEKNEEHFDVSFAYYFRWDCPDTHIKEALRQLLSSRIEVDDEPTVRQTYEQDVSRIRWLIATNPNTPPRVLDHLVTRGDFRLRERIAENPRTTTNTLMGLAQDTSPEVRAAVAENCNTPTIVLRSLCQDENADVRYRLAENPNLPEDLLRELTSDENPYVAHRAQRTLNRLTIHEPLTGPFYSLPWLQRADG